MILFNPNQRSRRYPDGKTDKIMQETIAFFERKGLKQLKHDWHERKWNHDYVDFLKEQQVFATLSGQRSEIITVLSTLAIAALFVPLRARVQAAVDRRFYRKKYDAQQVMQKFSQTVRDETDLEKLTGELVHVVQETMQPKSVTVWLKQDSRPRTATAEVTNDQ